MRAIFYKLVDTTGIQQPNSWWKKDVEVNDFDMFWELCREINWTKKTQRFAYLYDIKNTDNQELVEKCKNYLLENHYDDAFCVIEKYYILEKLIFENSKKCNLKT